ncbi:hypothetical protein IJT17_03205, partial [bacterium]|nr:hypothetical protein [bacterium]
AIIPATIAVFPLSITPTPYCSPVLEKNTTRALLPDVDRSAAARLSVFAWLASVSPDSAFLAAAFAVSLPTGLAVFTELVAFIADFPQATSARVIIKQSSSARQYFFFIAFASYA